MVSGITYSKLAWSMPNLRLVRAINAYMTRKSTQAVLGTNLAAVKTLGTDFTGAWERRRVGLVV